MRRIVPFVALGGLVLSLGCNNTRLGVINRPPAGGVAAAPGQVPSTTQLVQYLDDNARVVRGIRSDDVDISVGTGIQAAIPVTGRLACQGPRNFRMMAGALGNQRVDLGSNDREFWFWVKD